MTGQSHLLWPVDYSGLGCGGEWEYEANNSELLLDFAVNQNLLQKTNAD